MGKKGKYQVYSQDIVEEVKGLWESGERICDISKAMSIPAGTIYNWRSRGWREKLDTSGNNRPVAAQPATNSASAEEIVDAFLYKYYASVDYGKEQHALVKELTARNIELSATITKLNSENVQLRDRLGNEDAVNRMQALVQHGEV